MERYVVMTMVRVSSDRSVPLQEQTYSPPLSKGNAYKVFNRLTMAEVMRPAGTEKVIQCHWVEPVEVTYDTETQAMIVTRILPPVQN